MSGGYANVDEGTVISMSAPRQSVGNNPDGWVVAWRNDATIDTISVYVVCADVGTPHQ